MNETATAEATEVIGLINSDTAIGTKFLLPEPEGRIVFQGIDNMMGVNFVFDTTDDAVFDGRIPLQEWNEEWAPKVEEVLWPDSQVPPEGEPVAPQAGTVMALTIKANHLSDIQSLNREVCTAKEAWDSSKAEAAEDKKRYDKLVIELTGMISVGLNAPLFDNADAEATDGEYRGWREIEMSSLCEPDLGDSILRKLSQNDPPILTLGDLSDWQKAKGETWAQDIPGIGERARAEIEAFQIAHLTNAAAETSQNDAAAEEQAA